MTHQAVFETLADMAARVGTVIGVSDWTAITQERINLFAQATGDFQWIHVDPERAARDFPGGKTIAHGFLSLSIIPEFMNQLFTVRSRKKGLNYGLNKVRFTAQVPCGSRIRLSMKLKEAVPMEGNGMRFTYDHTVELEGSERPACVAEMIAIIYE